MKRFFPAPLLSAALAAIWLLLNRSLDPGQLLLAAVVGLALPLVTAPLRPLPVRMRRPGVLLRLIADVAVDVVRSNIAVALGVLRSGRRPPRAAFVTVPLELREPHALAALAIVTAIVPGTVWCELASDHSALVLHVFDVDDEAAFLDHYKACYERPLLEIFG